MNKPTKLQATLTSAGLSLLFLVVYGGCNWIAAHRGDVGTWYYSWERFIPFVPLMIVPYMSIDLFFVAAPFVCSSRDELKLLSRRIALAIVIAGIFFLAMPLKMGVPRPPVSGWTGALFHLLHGFDQPYNLCPSLHIALRTILAALYARHTKGITRIASHVWFSLIGFSTLLTYQHHFVDVVGGFVLAAFCFYFVRERQGRSTFSPNRRVGSYYATASIFCFCAAFAAWPWTAILFWPALSLSIVATGYWYFGLAVFGKREGKLPWSTRVILAPVILGQYLSLFYYRRQTDAWNQVLPHLWIGAGLHEREAKKAKRAGVTAVLDLTTEFSAPPAFRSLAYYNLPVLDLTELTPEHLRAAVQFISQHIKSGVVYVHCKVGYSRSAAAVGAYLIAAGHATDATDALKILKRSRPNIIFRPEVLVALEKFCRAEKFKRADSLEPLATTRSQSPFPA